MLELIPLPGMEPDQFTTTQELWHPPGGRGIFGGVILGLALSAAQQTVADGFNIHSMHCYFLLVGDSTIPVTFSVQRVRDSNSFITRTISANQKQRCIFMGTMSFMRQGSGGTRPLHHASLMPDWLKPPGKEDEEMESTNHYTPQVLSIGLENRDADPQDQILRCWLRIPQKISQSHNCRTHQVILAFLSDWQLISTIVYTHRLWEFPAVASSDSSPSPLEGTSVSMLTSLDHTMLFHEPLDIRTDEWMLLESKSPWSGGGRGLATSRIFARDGTHLATCVQEGVVRLKKDVSNETAKI
ncbi:thioesterase-like superfamily-domain-containing protein [Dactylonectria macrodidyma]|uniref:Thioesterase-like superfamily-domain-containing protein n=1 Tax=Dactylonectria macrodidyma TaxID=307937 RepID=A0A9P9ELE0_9HYPO|nr:thioesterase-like superfamily-domain-containing protein [Dactylonectria macrodidyma]